MGTVAMISGSALSATSPSALEQTSTTTTTHTTWGTTAPSSPSGTASVALTCHSRTTRPGKKQRKLADSAKTHNMYFVCVMTLYHID